MPPPPPPRARAAVAAKNSSKINPGIFKFRRVVWAGAFAAVTIAGAMYGANLKSEQQVKAVRRSPLLPLSPSFPFPFPFLSFPFSSFPFPVPFFWPSEVQLSAVRLTAEADPLQKRREIAEATAEDRIAALQSRRALLLDERRNLEEKMAALDERMARGQGDAADQPQQPQQRVPPWLDRRGGRGLKPGATGRLDD